MDYQDQYQIPPIYAQGLSNPGMSQHGHSLAFCSKIDQVNALPLAFLFSSAAKAQEMSYIWLDNTQVLTNASNMVEISWPTLEAGFASPSRSDADWTKPYPGTALPRFTAHLRIANDVPFPSSVTKENVMTNVAAISYSVPPLLIGSNGFPNSMDSSYTVPDPTQNIKHNYSFLPTECQQDLKISSWGSFKSQTRAICSANAFDPVVKSCQDTLGLIRANVLTKVFTVDEVAHTGFNNPHNQTSYYAASNRTYVVVTVFGHSANISNAVEPVAELACLRPTWSVLPTPTITSARISSTTTSVSRKTSAAASSKATSTQSASSSSTNASPTLVIHYISKLPFLLRHNEAFAGSKAVQNLCLESDNRSYAHAHNARFIISNVVPEMLADNDKPYCIWYPHMANKDTYHNLAKQYPGIQYLVGQAYAVTGYTKLYSKLDILPEVSIAEEARDNLHNEGSKAIFDTIIRQPVCYQVLDDYNRRLNIDSPSSPAWMNGNVAVQSTLNGLHYFNIAEDYNINQVSSDTTNHKPLAAKDLTLFHTPLLSHLPTTNKDALILMAAYKGNLDRYVRLRRPVMLYNEAKAIVRGIYHNTTFAKWWSLQELQPDQSLIKAAYIARFIMYNMPSLIWWPLVPREATLKELTRLQPDMKLQEQAHQQQNNSWPSSPNQNYFVDYLAEYAKELGVSVHRTNNATDCLDAAVRDKEPTTLWLSTYVAGRPYALVNSKPSGSIYPGGSQAKAAKWELLIYSSEELRHKAEDSKFMLYNDYVFSDKE
ncbi:LOW QUALITY PROTEIN: uncharacterized protein LY79DRAFT_595499 [Colletotrichum navitas]|uniref:Uncharacterized protein n=1 Tax=Colletotrichum navitas TaxID=681940 RepID=A0AAD8PIL2_9PEZI|nr:LOW QUALITY PROTEIN: uncharacterized protein LY79DRAFT_595499 [Colletotrichum navitas]KAK1561503.1 LOW QUALITY PROTEIN: hypothetical protein LY79DRAFT_595499 [Colletotrichum navitas]